MTSPVTRKALRDRVAAVVRATLPGVTVFTGHYIAVTDDNLPCAAVYFNEGQQLQQGLATQIHMSGQLDIDFYIRDSDGDDMLDQLADPAMLAVLNDPSSGV